MEVSRFQWDDYEYGLTDLDGLETTLALVQQDPPPIKSAILFDALTRDYRDVLPGIDVPTLVCAGADEKRGSVAAVKHVAHLVPDAEFELFEESGHCPMLEEPERFDRVVSRFVESE